MVTGIETVALVLAALPLIISALEHYNEGFKPLKDFVRFKLLIKQLICDLNTQKLRLRYTCEKLLIDLALSDGELACLLDDPKCSAWQAESLVLQLKERLRDSYATYLELLDRLANTLFILASKIGLDGWHQPQWVDAKTHKRYWKRFTICLIRKEHDALMIQMARDNDNLHHLTADNLQLEPRRLHRHNQKKAFTQKVKISEKKTVAWAIAPGVEAASMHFAERNVASEEGVSKTKAKDIDDLCSLLRVAKEGPTKTVLGQFACKESRYEVARVCRYNSSDLVSSTFHDLLLEQGQNPSQLGTISSPTGATMLNNSPRLTRKARLELATILASTVLQLHTTPWLRNDWSGKDIRICKGSRDHPYISHVFSKSDQGSSIQSSPKPQFGPIRNQAIFRLGVLLLELSLGKPLDVYKTSDKLIPFEDFVLASQLIEGLAGEESDSYISATHACIFGNFGCKAKDLDLDDDAFRRAVYEVVVLPLEQDLEYFCKGP
ncbi:MAG: hypothetical protein Q9208_000200 [Pyrenodesmia sp. 3 TL-2023]